MKLRYQLLHPEWEIVIAGGGDPWSKARAVNLAVETSVGEYASGYADVLVVADADCIVSRWALDEAVDRVEQGAPWAMPSEMVFRLSKDYTAAVLAEDPKIEPHPVKAAQCEKRTPMSPYRGLPGGGVFVCSRQAWETVGGFDERFEGWRGEDVSLGRALDTLAGPHERMNAPLWHLWHLHALFDPAQRGFLEANYQLEMEYQRANGHPKAMHQLVRRESPTLA